MKNPMLWFLVTMVNMTGQQPPVQTVKLHSTTVGNMSALHGRVR